MDATMLGDALATVFRLDRGVVADSLIRACAAPSSPELYQLAAVRACTTLVCGGVSDIQRSFAEPIRSLLVDLSRSVNDAGSARSRVVRGILALWTLEPQLGIGTMDGGTDPFRLNLLAAADPAVRSAALAAQLALVDSRPNMAALARLPDVGLVVLRHALDGRNETAPLELLATFIESFARHSQLAVRRSCSDSD